MAFVRGRYHCMISYHSHSIAFNTTLANATLNSNAIIPSVLANYGKQHRPNDKSDVVP